MLINYVRLIIVGSFLKLQNCSNELKGVSETFSNKQDSSIKHCLKHCYKWQHSEQH